MTIFSLGRARNPHNFSSDLIGGKNKIDAPGCYCARGHIRHPGCIKFLRDRCAADFSYGAQRCRPVTVIARDNDRDQLALPVLR